MVRLPAAAPLVWAIASATGGLAAEETKGMSLGQNGTVWCPENLHYVDVHDACDLYGGWVWEADNSEWLMRGFWPKFCENSSHLEVHLRYYRAGLYSACSTDADCDSGDVGCPVFCDKATSTCSPARVTPEPGDECIRYGDTHWIHPESAKSLCQVSSPSPPPPSSNGCKDGFDDQMKQHRCDTLFTNFDINNPPWHPNETKGILFKCYDVFQDFYYCNKHSLEDGSMSEGEYNEVQLKPEAWGSLGRLIVMASAPFECPGTMWRWETHDRCSDEYHYGMEGETMEWSVWGSWRNICENPDNHMLDLWYSKRGVGKECSTDADCAGVFCDTYCRPCDPTRGHHCEHAATCEPKVESECRREFQFWMSPDVAEMQCVTVPEPRRICLDPVESKWEEVGCNSFFENATGIPDAKRKATICVGLLDSYKTCFKKHFEESDPLYYEMYQVPEEYYGPFLPYIGGPARKCVNIPAYQAEEMKVLPCK